jgi:hypothetical protein
MNEEVNVEESKPEETKSKIQFKLKMFKGNKRYVLEQVVPEETPEDATRLSIEVTAGGVKIYGGLHGMLETPEDVKAVGKALANAMLQKLKMQQDVRRRLMGLKG